MDPRSNFSFSSSTYPTLVNITSVPLSRYAVDVEPGLLLFSFESLAPLDYTVGSRPREAKKKI